MKTNYLILVLSALGCMLSATPASATLIGDHIYGVLEAPNAYPGDNLWDGVDFDDDLTPVGATVGYGDEFSVTLNNNFYADFGADWFKIGTRGGAPVIGDDLYYDFFDLDYSTGNIKNVTLSWSGFTDVFWDWTGNSIHVIIPDQALSEGDTAAYFAVETPEPGMLILLGTGLAGLALSRRRRKA